MTLPNRVGIAGVGFSVPEAVRRNDDPVFDWLKEHAADGGKLFQGYDQRRILAPQQTTVDISVAAAQRTLDIANTDVTEVEMLLGTVSPSPYVCPNALAEVHHRLGLRSSALVVPICNDFVNFNTALMFASALITQGSIGKALIVCGGGWSRCVNYHTPQSVSAADGAAAALVSGNASHEHFSIVDFDADVFSEAYGSMFLAGEEVSGANPMRYSRPYFQITAEGLKDFQSFGLNRPPQVAKRLLDKHGLSGDDVTLISHQASSVLMDGWRDAIAPKHYVNTIREYANVTVANVPLNWATRWGKIETDYLLLLAIGTEMQTHVLLLHRPPGYL